MEEEATGFEPKPADFPEPALAVGVFSGEVDVPCPVRANEP